MNKEKFIQILQVADGWYLGLTSDGRLFRAYELHPDTTAWEEINTPDLTKTQPRITKRKL